MPGYATPVTTWSYTDSDGGAVGTVGRTLVVNQGETVDSGRAQQARARTPGSSCRRWTASRTTPSFPAPTTGTPDPNHTYSFTATRPGTFLYEAGSTPQASRQVAMGLVGALVVLPPALAGQPAGAPTTSAYGAPTRRTPTSRSRCSPTSTPRSTTPPAGRTTLRHAQLRPEVPPAQRLRVPGDLAHPRDRRHDGAAAGRQRRHRPARDRRARGRREGRRDQLARPDPPVRRRGADRQRR